MLRRLDRQERQRHHIRQRGLLGPIALHAPADVGDAAADALPHVDALDQGLRREHLDLDAALGGLLDLLDPGIKRVRRTPAGRRILVGEGELDFLRGAPEPSAPRRQPQRADRRQNFPDHETSPAAPSPQHAAGHWLQVCRPDCHRTRGKQAHSVTRRCCKSGGDCVTTMPTPPGRSLAFASTVPTRGGIVVARSCPYQAPRPGTSMPASSRSTVSWKLCHGASRSLWLRTTIELPA